ncbi:LamG domain-containing protein [Rubritalea spongiae]
MHTPLSKKATTNQRAITLLITTLISASSFTAHAQNPGDRAQKYRGTWWGNIHPSLLDDRLLSLKTIDGWGINFTSGASASANHFAPVPLLSGLAGYSDCFPATNDNTMQGYIDKIRGAGCMVRAYTNCENFLGTNGTQHEAFVASWKNWCDTNATAQAFINSQSYHTKDGYPDRPYLFCYAEFILKHYSLTYGHKIDTWVFDDAQGSMAAQGDNPTSGNEDDQRLYLAFADAARAGNDDIAVAFNNGRSTVNYDSFPYAHAVRGDDFTFGHAFGGNTDHASKENGAFYRNYQHITRMTETNGYVHAGGAWSWDDNIVGHFMTKLSTTAWDYGPVPAWEQDDLNQWHEEALLAGGMTVWGGSFNRTVTTVYPWVYDQLEAVDNYLFENGISINSFTPDPDKVYHIENPTHGFRIAADGNSETPYTTSLGVNNDDTRWKFVPQGNGYYHIQRAAGGVKPRLRTDNTSSPDMQATSSSGVYTYYSIMTSSHAGGTYYLTLPDGPADYQRMGVHSDGSMDFDTISNVGENFSLRIVEADEKVNPVARWNFDEETGNIVNDITDNGHDATVSDGTWGDGTLDFNGTSSTVQLPNSVFSGISDEISVAMWIYGDTNQPRRDSIFYATNASGQRVLNIHLPWNNSQVYWDAGRDASGSVDRINLTANATTFKEQWNHWVFTKNATTGTMAIYVNGALFHQGAGFTTPIQGITNASIGSAINSLFYDGAIDDVALYDTALTATEVTNLYNEGFFNPLAVWNFNEEAGTLAEDSSGNGYNGIVTNGTWETGALSFNGTDTKVSIPANLFSEITHEISISMWIDGDDTQARKDSIFSAFNSAGNRVFNIHLPWSDSQVYWDAGVGDRINATADASSFKNGLNHWVFTKNAITGEMAIYLNGSLFQSGTGNTSAMSGVISAFIGSENGSSFYAGAIDKLSIYNIALDAQTISELFHIENQ